MTTVAVSGELDLVSSPTLADALERANQVEADVVVLDLRKLEFMDSTGLHLVIKAQHQIQASGRRFAMIRGSEQVDRLLALTGVAELVKIVDSPEAVFEADRTQEGP